MIRSATSRWSIADHDTTIVCGELAIWREGITRNGGSGLVGIGCGNHHAGRVKGVARLVFRLVGRSRDGDGGERFLFGKRLKSIRQIGVVLVLAGDLSKLAIDASGDLGGR